MNKWNQNELIAWIESLPSDASFSSSVKQEIIDGIKKYAKTNNSEVTGEDFYDADDASDIKEMVGVDNKKSKALFRKIGDKKQEEFDKKKKEKGSEPGAEGVSNNDDIFTLNVIGGQGKAIPLRGMTKKSTVAQVKAKYLEEEGNQTAADSYRSGQWDKWDGNAGKISLKYGGKSMDDKRSLESYNIINGLGMPPVVGFHVIGGSNESQNNTEHQYTEGQLVQAEYCLDDDSKIWINAKIVNVFPNYIEIKYLDQVPNYNGSLESIMDQDIASKIRAIQEEEKQDEEQNEGQDVKEMVTPQFKVDQIVEYKVDTESNKDELWVNATIIYVAMGAKFIKVEVKYNDNLNERVLVNDSKYKERIRLKTPKTKRGKDKDKDKDKDKNKGKDEGKDKGKNKDKDKGKCKGKGEGKDKSKKTIFKKSKPCNEKGIIEWNAVDVKEWVQSMSSFKKYACSFPKDMDGKELLDTTIDDLTLIIPKKLWRRKFMKQLELAKQKYIKINSTNNDNIGVGDDDEKNTKRSNVSNGSNGSCVNGIVGLHNLGNTCYMNTSIQILSQSPYITRYLRKRAKFCKQNAATNGNSGGVLNWMYNKLNGGDDYDDNCNEYAMLNAWTELCDIIYNQYRSHSYSFTTASPSNIRNALNGIDTAFGSGRQDDSIRSLDHMLQALDEQIEREIMQKTGKTNIKYKDNYNIRIFHGKILTKSEEESYIDELLRDHNPNNSILRKSFDGIERIICQCLECNKLFQQFVAFRIVDLPVISHEIQFKNINIITSNDHYKLPEISMLDYCSINLLKYHVIHYLLLKQKQNEKEEIDYNNIRIVTISGNNGKLKYIKNNDKLSELQEITNGNEAILVLVNNNSNNNKHKSNKSSILQFNLSVGKNSNKIKQISVKYNKYNPYTIHELISNEIATYIDDDDDEKYDYYVDYNGNVLTQKELNSETFKQNMHNMNGINLLILLCVNRENKEYCYDINDIDHFIKYEAEERYSNCLSLDALNKFKTWWNNKKIKISKQYINHCKDIENGIDLQLMKINKTMNVLQRKQHILYTINNWICNKYKLCISNTRKLRDLMECLSEYEKEKIMDDTSYVYPCPHCNNGSNSQWVKVTKKIVYSPPIFLFHLDRFGKNMKQNYDDISDQRYNNYYSSNKFEHGIKYELELNYQYSSPSQAIYNLYGVSNHSGSTNGGHYTATIKCLTDGNWYDISDSGIDNQSVKPLQHSKSATILAYVRDLE